MEIYKEIDTYERKIIESIYPLGYINRIIFLTPDGNFVLPQSGKVDKEGGKSDLPFIYGKMIWV